MVVSPCQIVSKTKWLDVGNDGPNTVLRDQARGRGCKQGEVPSVLGYIVYAFLSKQLQSHCIELRYVVAPKKERVLVLSQLAEAL